MKQLTIFLQKWGLHSLLLPVFFVIHNYSRYFGLVSSAVAFQVFFKLIVFFLLLFILTYLVVKDRNKSFKITTLLGAVFLFYGVLKDFFQLTIQIRFISKHSVLMPLLLITSVFIIRSILKKPNSKKGNLFLNLLLISFILLDILTFLYSNNNVLLQKNILTKQKNIMLESLPLPSSKPDIYYLVFDSYPGSNFLKKIMLYDNSQFDSSLKEKGFYVTASSKSNYAHTGLSISSTLNFQYLNNINTLAPVSPKLYSQAKLTIKQSIVPDILYRYQYSIFNLSMFDIGNIPAIRKETFLNLPEKDMLMYTTLTENIKRDLLWNLIEGEYSIPAIKKIFSRKTEEVISEETGKRNFNNIIIDSLSKISLQNKSGPKFVYAHLYLPHQPFFYNENGEENDFNYVINEESQNDKKLFVSYLKYTNKVILELINKIIQHSGDKAIIIVQSDHGFRGFEAAKENQEMFFNNYSAFYFPDRNYSSLYSTMSNINTFPILFNKYFNLNIPLLKDTSIAVPY